MQGVILCEHCYLLRPRSCVSIRIPSELRIWRWRQRQRRCSRLRHVSATDQPNAISRFQRLFHRVNHIVDWNGRHHLHFDEVVTVDSMFADRRQRQPRSCAVVVPIERNSQEPGIDNDEVAGPRVLLQFLGNKIDVCLSLYKFRPGGKWKSDYGCDDRNEPQQTDPTNPTKRCDDQVNVGSEQGNEGKVMSRSHCRAHRRARLAIHPPICYANEC
jgi:hypothetical protein